MLWIWMALAAAGYASSPIRVDSNLVLISVSVVDRDNRPVPGMSRDGFRLFEGGSEQTITNLSSEEAPISVGIVFDTSGSMGVNLQRSREALAEFFKVANPEDEFFLVRVSDGAELLSDFTHNAVDLQNRLLFAPAAGRTSLVDGIYLAANLMRKAANPRRAVLVLSDGGDNRSRYTAAELRRALLETDVPVYTIGVFDAADGLTDGLSSEENSGSKLLGSLAECSGGRQYVAHSRNELPAIAAQVGGELHSQYVLAYRPVNQRRDGRYRPVRVKLVNPPRGRQVHWRQGYFAPAR